MINKFISELSEQGKKLLAIALIIVIVALFDRLLIGPTMSRLASIDEETAKEEQSIKEDLRFLNYKDKILKESKDVAPYLTDKLPPESEISTALLKKIEIIATKANIVLSKEVLSNTPQDPNNPKYSADIECTGDLKSIVNFMHLVNTSEELIKVVKFNLGSKKTDSDDIKATMTIAKIIVFKKADKKLLEASSSSVPQSDAADTKKN
ncbi:MAG: hypothetical protein HQL15_07325 [Candidatus Omnitrophica bacterium]|nr:hypothetical protein [Candidatus Omnitrophota bacterium]